MYRCSLAHINRLRNRSFRLSISAPILQRPRSPRAAEPDVPPSNPRHTLTNIFCTFSSFNSLVWLSIHNSAPYNICGRAIRLHSLVATTGLIPLNLHPRLAKPIPIAWPLLAASRIGMRLSTYVCQFFPRLCQTSFSAIVLPPICHFLFIIADALCRSSPKVSTTVFFSLKVSLHFRLYWWTWASMQSRPRFNLDINVRSSANIGDPTDRFWITIPEARFSNSVIISSMKRRNNHGDNTPPCRTPCKIVYGFERFPWKKTYSSMSEYQLLISLQHFPLIFTLKYNLNNMPFIHTLSNALDTST